MTIDSMPSGANVFDGEQMVGTTPFTTVLENKLVAGSPRKLTLRLDGYEPFTVVQGPSDVSVRTAAKLMPVRERPSSVSEPAPAQSATTTAVVKQKKPAPKPAPQRPPASSVPAAPADIRLER
jgi:serine/threonine-protein kinase